MLQFWGCNIKLGDLNLDNNNTFFDEKLMKNLRNSFTDTGKNLFAACKSCLSVATQRIKKLSIRLIKSVLHHIKNRSAYKLPESQLRKNKKN